MLIFFQLVISTDNLYVWENLLGSCYLDNPVNNKFNIQSMFLLPYLTKSFVCVTEYKL